MAIKVYLDLDGTLFDLYHKENWLDMLENEVSGVFKAYGENWGLMPKLDDNHNNIFDAIAYLQHEGVSFGIISWLPFAASPEYEEICRQEKLDWLATFFPMITEIHIIPYGIEKQKAITKRAETMYLIDDNAEICNTWTTAKQRKAIQVSENFTASDALNQIIKEM